MKSKDLQKLWQETYPVLPGQEERAWLNLKSQLGGKELNSIFSVAGLSWVSASLILALVGFFYYLPSHHVYIASADSRQPGVYASSFYSDTAHAQVVWLEGLPPASDQPTSQDPTTLNDAVLRLPADATPNPNKP